MLRFTPVSLLLSLLCLAPACGVSPNANDGDEVSSELRALRSNEIIGTLAYGQTSDPVDYTNTPLYRAFQFQGTAGDQVDVWVRSNEGDARGWIVNSAFKNLATNDNANSGTRDAHMTATLSTSGTHYIVLREKTSDDASFTVSLAQLNGGGGGSGSGTDAGDAATLDDPFTLDPAKPALTHQELLDYLNARDSADGTLVGTFEIRSRKRVCPGACATWLPWSPVELVAARGRSLVQIGVTGQIYALRTQLVLIAALPGPPSVTAGHGYFFSTLSLSDTSNIGELGNGGPQLRFTGQRPFSPKNLLEVPFSDTSFYFPGEGFDGMSSSGTSLISTRGHAYKDGTLKLTSLVGSGGTGYGTHQLAIVGNLDGLAPTQPSAGCTTADGRIRYLCKGPFPHSSGAGYAVWSRHDNGESCMRGCASGWDYYNDPPMPLWACEKSAREYFCRE